MTPATGNSLHGRPLKFSRDLQISGRAYDYTFYDLAVNTDATESRTVADRLPSNIGLIESRIDAPRHDTPSALQFHRFLQKLSKAMRTGSAGAARETALVACFTSFLGSSLEDGSCDLSATQVWSGLIDSGPDHRS